jgi:hypothetical protein
MDNITGLNLNENLTYTNINTKTINNKNIVDEFDEQDIMQLEILELKQKVNLLTSILNELLNKDIELIS